MRIIIRRCSGLTASSYKEARQQLIRDYVISFAGRIPAQEKMS
ncbi:TPA: host cell division inhibitor Icd-like protein [Yersinia enterocolitica]|nr:host cell division inhibitor Icd-like protein [Yersinia enterocolitica]